MEPDFSGWATKSGLKCSDGRTIMPGAFEHQDKLRVPLVWQHGHNDPENVLGHAILEARAEGVWCEAFFNDSDRAKQSKGLVQHKDITMLSIWANNLIERGGKVFHGAIREVSLVLSGANPGATIESVTVHHSDGDEIIDDEAIIYTGLSIDIAEDAKHSATDIVDDETIEDETKPEDEVIHADGEDETVGDIYNTMTKKQKDVVHYMIGQIVEDGEAAASLKQDNIDDKSDETEKGSEMKHNVFDGTDGDKPELYHMTPDDVKTIVTDGVRLGSLKESVTNFALAHGITDIDLLFPDAQAMDVVPEYLQRRTEWVGAWLTGARKSPFNRIKTLSADITHEEARAKGYVTGEMKREEFFGVLRRVTTPTTVYKKQKLDRDDIIDITDFDVVSWLKAEMRIMLDEEIARAALMGDGRDVSDVDKINEQNIRPIATDHELYVTTLRVNLLDTTTPASSVQEFIDAVILNRHKYKGTGLPTMYTKETVIAQFLLLKDTLGRDLYPSIDALATKLRVTAIVPVEAMEDDDELLAIFVNPADYVYGATRGGEVSMFDDFDIDYNQYKYLIETRCCGALTKLKSALVIRGQASTDTLISLVNAPTYNEDTRVVTIVATTHVVYKNADTDATISGAQPALAVGETLNVRAVPAAGYYVADSDDTYWSFTGE